MKDYVSLIAPYTAKLSCLDASFSAALAIPAHRRLAWGKGQRDTVYRDGWYINTPVGANGDGETLAQHVDHLHGLIDQYVQPAHRSLAHAYAEVHDDPEVIAYTLIKGVKRDINLGFNNLHQLTAEDKKEIETLAADVLFEAAPDQHALWVEYSKQADEAARLLKGLDRICVMWKCFDYIDNGYTYDDFNDYWKHWTPEHARKKLPAPIYEAYANLLKTKQLPPSLFPH